MRLVIKKILRNVGNHLTIDVPWYDWKVFRVQRHSQRDGDDLDGGLEDWDREQVPLKHLQITGLHCVISQMTVSTSKTNYKLFSRILVLDLSVVVWHYAVGIATHSKSCTGKYNVNNNSQNTTKLYCYCWYTNIAIQQLHVSALSSGHLQAVYS